MNRERKDVIRATTESMIEKTWTWHRVEGDANYQRHWVIKQGDKEVTRLYFTKSPVDNEESTRRQAVKITDAHNASLGEPREKEDLGEKEPSSALTPVLQNQLWENLVTLVNQRRYRGPKRDEAMQDRFYWPLEIQVMGDIAEVALQLVVAVEKTESVQDSNAVLPPPVSEKEDAETLINISAAAEWFPIVEQYIGDPKHLATVIACKCRQFRHKASSIVSESPVGSTATGVEDEEIAKQAWDAIEHGLRFEGVIVGFEIILTAIRKSKSLSEPKELEEEKKSL